MSRVPEEKGDHFGTQDGDDALPAKRQRLADGSHGGEAQVFDAVEVDLPHTDVDNAANGSQWILALQEQCPTIWSWLREEQARGIPIRWLLVFLGQFYSGNQMSEESTLGIFAAALCPQDTFASAAVAALLAPENMIVCHLFPERLSPTGRNGLFDHNPFWKEEAARPDLNACVIHGYLTGEQAWHARSMLSHGRVQIARKGKRAHEYDWTAPVIFVLPEEQGEVDWKRLVHFAAVFALHWKPTNDALSTTIEHVTTAIASERPAFVAICKRVFEHQVCTVPTHQGLYSSFRDITCALPWSLGPLQRVYDTFLNTLPSLPEDLLHVLMDFVDDRSVRLAPGWPASHRKYTGCCCNVCEDDTRREVKNDNKKTVTFFDVLTTSANIAFKAPRS